MTVDGEDDPGALLVRLVGRAERHFAKVTAPFYGGAGVLLLAVGLGVGASSGTFAPLILLLPWLLVSWRWLTSLVFAARPSRAPLVRAFRSHADLLAAFEVRSEAYRIVLTKRPYARSLWAVFIFEGQKGHRLRVWPEDVPALVAAVKKLAPHVDVRTVGVDVEVRPG